MHQSILSYEEFVNYIQENLEAILNDDSETAVIFETVVKNNGVKAETLTVRQDGSHAAPVFYMRDIYEQYLRGISADELIDQMLIVCRQDTNDVFSEQGEWFESFENVRERIIMKVVNLDRNRERLELCPYIRRLDLALTFRVLVEEDGSQIGTVLVNDALIRQWEVTEDALYDLAAENMRRRWRSVLKPVQDMAREMMDEEMEESYDWFLEDHLAAQQMPLYVLTNEIRLNGASVLFYTDAVKRFARAFGSDIFILPSSIHEVLLIPVVEGMSALDMRQVVEQVNQQMVSEEELLSNHVYRYLYRQDKLIIAA